MIKKISMVFLKLEESKNDFLNDINMNKVPDEKSLEIASFENSKKIENFMFSSIRETEQLLKAMLSYFRQDKLQESDLKFESYEKVMN